MSFTRLVILDTAWGPVQLPKLFAISHTNKSGRLLYRLMPDRRFVVGDSCEKTTKHASHHGDPDRLYLSSVIVEACQRFDIDTFILGGKIAQATFDELATKVKPFGSFDGIRQIRIPHPAARFWTHEMMDHAKAAIADMSIKTWSMT